jgi:hypothetical protein
MSPDGDRADDALLAALGETVERVDPVPEALVAAARSALTWRTVDEELAELSFDSSEERLVGVRAGAPTQARQLTFDADGATVEVELTDGRLVGQLLPPGPARVELRHGAEVTMTDADDLGRFALDVRVSPLPETGTGARWRLRIESDAFRLVTAWFVP